MVRISGVDPILIERIRERTRTQVGTVGETDQYRKIEQKEREERQDADAQQYRAPNKRRTAFAIEKLNILLEELAAPIRFVMVLKGNNMMVQILDVTMDKVLGEIVPEKVYQLLHNIDDPKGFVVDNSV